MTCHPKPTKHVLAIDPTTHGVGYVALNGPHMLLDWAIAGVKPVTNKHCLRRLADLFDRYQPDVLVLENLKGEGSRRGARVRRLLIAVSKLAEKRGITVCSFSPKQVRETFADTGASNKDDVAALVAQRYPELIPRLPPRRRIWDPEDYRMGIFDAAAFALTYFRFTSCRTASRPSVVEAELPTPAEKAVENFLARGRTAAVR